MRCTWRAVTFSNTVEASVLLIGCTPLSRRCRKTGRPSHPCWGRRPRRGSASPRRDPFRASSPRRPCRWSCAAGSAAAGWRTGLSRLQTPSKGSGLQRHYTKLTCADATHDDWKLASSNHLSAHAVDATVQTNRGCIQQSGHMRKAAPSPPRLPGPPAGK
jgi:hypothetical protein